MAFPKRAAVINDLSGMGRCSLCADIAVLSAMGITLCPLPTAALSHQTAFGSFYREDLTKSMELSADEWRKSRERFDAVLSGYAANAEQLGLISKFISDFRSESTVVIVDPIMGDDGELYPSYDRAAADKMRSLARSADILTPNLTELCFLSGADYDLLSRDCPESLERIAEAAEKARAHSSQRLVVTGIRGKDVIRNLCVDKDGVEIISQRRMGGYFSGTGDLFSAVICGCALNGFGLADSVRTAADFLSASIERTLENGTNPLYGVDFEPELYRLINDKSRIDRRKI